MPKLVLARALEKHKVSKRQFAKRLGAQYHSVFQFFKEGYNPTFKMMCRWAEAVPCKVRELIDDDPPKKRRK